MNTKVRNAVVTAVGLVLASFALALNNGDLITYLDYGAPRVSSQAQRDALRPAAPVALTEVEEMQLKKELEAMGLRLD